VGQRRAMHMYLFQENLRYDKMAEGLGAVGEYVRSQEYPSGNYVNPEPGIGGLAH
jgi:hypothetical protein